MVDDRLADRRPGPGQGGLVQIEIGRGAVARRLRLTDVQDLYGVRTVLELNGVRESAGAA